MASAISIDDFKKNIETFLAQLPNEIARVNNGIALSTIPFIKDRLISQGVDGKGKSLGKYSTSPLPSFFFTHKGLGSGADDKFKALEKRKKKSEGKGYKGISYTEFRELNNRPVDHVTLSFTGETLNDIGVVEIRHDGNIIVTEVGSLATKTKAKYNAKGDKVGENTTEKILDFLGERYGADLLAVNEEEEKVMAEAFDDELQLIVNKYLG